MTIDLEAKLAEADALAAETVYEFKSLDELKHGTIKFTVDLKDLFKATLREVLSTPDDEVIMNVPLPMSFYTTKNQSRLIENDKTSPKGMIIKNFNVYDTLKVNYAIGQFKADDIISWVRKYHPEIIKQITDEAKKK